MQEDLILSLETLYKELFLSAHKMKILNKFVKGPKVRSINRKTAVRVYRFNGLEWFLSTNWHLFLNTTFCICSNQHLLMEMKWLWVWQITSHKSTAFYDPPKLPCLHVGPANKNIFPFKICQLDGPQKVNKKLNEKQTKVIIKATAVDATCERFASFYRHIRQKPMHITVYLER